ncbi:MAG: hypothetical protein CMJ18_10095 [Phycisphaeraceae bacterium]|nr:hypothetical protein [Phycisphaeraceae bacterium]
MKPVPTSEPFRIGRVLLIAAPLIVLGAIVIQYTGVYRAAPSSDLTLLQHELARRPWHMPGVPSAMVFGLFVPLLVGCAAVPLLRRRWAVTRGELIAVFCMLFLAVPVLGSAFWHQFPGLQIEYLRVRRLSQAMGISPYLWPNQANLLQGASVEDAPGPGIRWTVDAAESGVVEAPDGPGRCLRIVHRSPEDQSRVTMELDRAQAARFVEPRFRYAICAQLRLDDVGPRSQVTLEAGVDAERLAVIANLGAVTEPSLLAPDRFVTTGRSDYLVPRELADHFIVQIRFTGTGALHARDVILIDTEDVFRFYEGYEEAGPRIYEQLPDGDRAIVRMRPDAGPDRWRHLLWGRVPWRSWARPLAVWSLFVVGTFLSMFCLVTVFYRDWEVTDRLTFPLQTFLQDLTRGDGDGRLLLWRSIPFWVGFGPCVLHLSLQRLHFYVPEIPAVSMNLFLPSLLPVGPIREGLATAGDAMVFDVRPAFVAVAFLMNLEMSFSLLVFFGLGLLYRVGGHFTPLRTMRLGAHGPTPLSPEPLLLGAFLFMACFYVYAARRHLAGVARRVLDRGGADDTSEAMTYRGAAIGLAVSIVLILGFAHFAQVSALFMLAYLIFTLLCAVTAARIRAETGLPHLAWLPGALPAVMFALGGVLMLGFRETLLPRQASFLFLGAFVMLGPIMAESMAAATRAGVPLRAMRTCLWAAFVIAFVVGGIVVLSWAYTVGSANMHPAVSQTWHQHENTMHGLDYQNQWIKDHFDGHPDEPPILTPSSRRQIARFAPDLFLVAGLSFAAAGLLTLARTMWLGFPLHPLGFALAFTPAMGALWPSIAVGHLLKRLGLRFGGVQFSRSTLRPFCVGLFVGDLLTMAAWRVLESLVFERAA